MDECLGSLVLIIIIYAIIMIIRYFYEKYIWNNGVCKKCGYDWMSNFCDNNIHFYFCRCNNQFFIYIKALKKI